MAASPKFVKFVAFWGMAFGRCLGVYRDPEMGVDTEARAMAYIRKLKRLPVGIRRQITLANLGREYDLLEGDEALNPNCLALQLKVVELAPDEYFAQKIAARMINDSPIPNLLASIVKQASNEGVAEVKICFDSSGEGHFKVWYGEGGSWCEAMTIPDSLSIPLRVTAVRAAAMGYSVWRSFLQEPYRGPEMATFSWPSDLEMHLGLGHCG